MIKDVTKKIVYLNKIPAAVAEQEAASKIEKDGYLRGLYKLQLYKSIGGNVEFLGGKEKNDTTVSAGFAIDLADGFGHFSLQKELAHSKSLEKIDKRQFSDLIYAAETLEMFLTYSFSKIQWEGFLQERFGPNKLDETYEQYHKAVNMTYDQLQKWSENECSKKASLTREPIIRNLRLLQKEKKGWTQEDIRDAQKTIAYLSRARFVKSKKPISDECKMNRNQAAMANWGYKSFKL